MESYQRRDLSIIKDFADSTSLVIACDSCGGIGDKEHDSLNTSPYFVAKFAARVGLYEVLSAGAKPVSVINGVCCEMNPTGVSMIDGIRDELKDAGIVDVILTGSTEENFLTLMTAVNVTVVGIAKNHELIFKEICSGDLVMLFGSPKMGGEIDLLCLGLYDEIRFLLKLDGVREIVPIGSKGIFYEANEVGDLNDRKFVPRETHIDLNKSAGPSTCIIAIVEKSCAIIIKCRFKNAICIGEFF